jgi:hypothetical protein
MKTFIICLLNNLSIKSILSILIYLIYQLNRFLSITKSILSIFIEINALLKQIYIP